MKKARTKLYLIATIIFVSTITTSIYLYSNGNGKTGQTRKTTQNGCGPLGCHGTSETSSLIVTINGPATLQLGQTAAYNVTISGSGSGGGIDIAASSGTLNPIVFFLRRDPSNGELTHTVSQPLSAVYSFNYTAPDVAGTVTMYAVGKGVGFNTWNWAPDKTITISNPPPVADFTGTPTSGVKPLTVQFADASTGVITSRSWNFGDGQTSSQQNPAHTYANAGTYTVSLTVTGPGG
ncbi:MAG: PKD domain-containing protein, partial [Nitrososphaera sp.]